MNSNSASVEEFESLCEVKRSEGLVDLKFCTMNSVNLTPEVFCDEANAIDEALVRGDYEEYRFNDSKKEKKQS